MIMKETGKIFCGILNCKGLVQEKYVKRRQQVTVRLGGSPRITLDFEQYAIKDMKENQRSK